MLQRRFKWTARRYTRRLIAISSRRVRCLTVLLLGVDLFSFGRSQQKNVSSQRRLRSVCVSIILALSREKTCLRDFRKSEFQPVSSATETSKKIEILSVTRRRMILFKKGIKKALNRLCGCAGWSAPVLFPNLRRQVFSRRGPYETRVCTVRILKDCGHDQHLITQQRPVLSESSLGKPVFVNELGGSVVECLTRDRGLRVRASPASLRCVLELDILIRA